MITVSNLSVTYPEASTPVFSGFHLSVPAGEKWAITGASGVGKTTLILCLAGLLTSDEGRIQVSGMHLHRRDDTYRSGIRNQSIGVVFQDYNLLPDLTARENLELRLAIAGKRGRSSEVEKALSEVGLEGQINRAARLLSGGQQQRLALARALITRPQVLLADEPTGNLDDHSAGKIGQVLMADPDRTVLIATHDPRLMAMVDHVCSFLGCCG